MSRPGVFIALPILCFAAQAFWHAWDKSPTYDEPVHMTVGFLLSKTDHRDYEVSHPPLIRNLFGLSLSPWSPSLPAQQLPVVPEGAALAEASIGYLYAYANSFVFANRLSADRMVFSARCVSVILGCLLAFWVYRWSSQIYGQAGGLFSLWIYALTPNLIAHGSLATTDTGGVAFGSGFLYSLSRLLRQKNLRNKIASGILLGLALLSKFTNLVLLPSFIFFYLLYAPTFKTLRALFLVLAIAWVTVCLGYGFDRVFTPHRLMPSDIQALGWNTQVQEIYSRLPLPDAFLKGIAYGAYHDRRGHASFFKGRHSSGGWKSYFPTAFLLKTPIATLLLALIWTAFYLKRRDWLNFDQLLILIPMGLLMAAAMHSHLNLGVRHILLVYPLLAVLLGLVGRNFLDFRKGVFLNFALIGAVAVETLSVAPHYLAFFNRACGGPGKGIQYLSDSNIDWGQDLKRLARYLKEEGNPELLLSYFGAAPPQARGIRFQALPTVWAYPKSEHLNSLRPAKELCAVSVTNLQGTYFAKHDLYAWLLRKEPLKKIGHSIYVYDVTNDLESQEKFMEIYAALNDKDKLMRQKRRAQMMRR